jgi:hypothetical protein
VQRTPDEAAVLFTLFADRYERRSVLITSNLVFIQWERIFKDQMAAAAAFDRLVHHAVILDLDVPSFRTDRGCGSSPAQAAAPERDRSSPTRPLLDIRPVAGLRLTWPAGGPRRSAREFPADNQYRPPARFAARCRRCARGALSESSASLS